MLVCERRRASHHGLSRAGNAPTQRTQCRSDLPIRFAGPAHYTSDLAIPMTSTPSAENSKLKRLLSEPTLHFFMLGALVFLVHRVFGDDSRTVEISPGLRADLTRQFQDRMGKTPSPAELDLELQRWKLDEVLYREALRAGLDREDASIRSLLTDKLRARLTQETPIREPSDSELDQWLLQHRDLYETQVLYEHEYIVFEGKDQSAQQKREQSQRALTAGATPASLGLRTVAAKITRERIERDFGRELADRIIGLAPGTWQALPATESLLLLRMIGIEGGLPSREQVRERLVNDWQAALKQAAVERKAQALLGHYRFEERTH